jgi:pimeloyl-ACP methyl ester carboxylesterase
VLINRLDGVEALADAIPNAAPGSKATATQRAFIRALILSQEPEGYASLCSVIASAQPPDYSAIKCPVLIVAGADDKTCPLSSSETILNR